MRSNHPPTLYNENESTADAEARDDRSTEDRRRQANTTEHGCMPGPSSTSLMPSHLSRSSPVFSHSLSFGSVFITLAKTDFPIREAHVGAPL